MTGFTFTPRGVVVPAPVATLPEQPKQILLDVQEAPANSQSLPPTPQGTLSEAVDALKSLPQQKPAEQHPEEGVRFELLQEKEGKPARATITGIDETKNVNVLISTGKVVLHYTPKG